MSHEKSFSVERRAKKDRRCDSCGTYIWRGSRYIEHAAPPGHDVLCNAAWAHSAECEWCATRYGRMKAVEGTA